MKTASPVGGFEIEQLRRVVELLDAHQDILGQRAAGPDAPAWCDARGWTPFLLDLEDHTVVECESRGAAAVLRDHTSTPTSLRALAQEALEATTLELATLAPSHQALHRASPRKRDQIEALAALAPAGAARILDFGSGRGHLTRRLAEAIGVPAVGFERTAAVAEVARKIEPHPSVRFESREIDVDLDVRPDDLLVGLHACGGLGDALIRCATQSGAGVLLVPCCPQKIEADVREPLSIHGRPLARELLGLANQAAAPKGVSAAGVRAEDGNMRRRARLALRFLLEDAGIPVSPGQEARGINRRRFREGLAGVAALAFARRNLPLPTDAAIENADAKATGAFERVRRFSIARGLLARPLELAVVFDRAAALALSPGPRPTVVEAFAPTVSPRNLLVRRGFD